MGLVARWWGLPRLTVDSESMLNRWEVSSVQVAQAGHFSHKHDVCLSICRTELFPLESTCKRLSRCHQHQAEPGAGCNMQRALGRIFAGHGPSAVDF